MPQKAEPLGLDEAQGQVLEFIRVHRLLHPEDAVAEIRQRVEWFKKLPTEELLPTVLRFGLTEEDLARGGRAIIEMDIVGVAMAGMVPWAFPPASTPKPRPQSHRVALFEAARGVVLDLWLKDAAPILRKVGFIGEEREWKTQRSVLEERFWEWLPLFTRAYDKSDREHGLYALRVLVVPLEGLQDEGMPDPATPNDPDPHVRKVARMLRKRGEGAGAADDDLAAEVRNEMFVKGDEGRLFHAERGPDGKWFYLAEDTYAAVRPARKGRRRTVSLDAANADGAPEVFEIADPAAPDPFEEVSKADLVRKVQEALKLRAETCLAGSETTAADRAAIRYLIRCYCDDEQVTETEFAEKSRIPLSTLRDALRRLLEWLKGKLRTLGKDAQ